MRRKTSLTRKLAVLLVFVLTLGLLSASAWASGDVSVTTAEETAPMTVTASIQGESGFYVGKHEIEVQPDLSERYGYSDQYNGTKVTVLDVLVALHELKYAGDADDIHDALMVSGASVTKALGINEMLVYFVNGEMLMVNILQSDVADGDEITFAFPREDDMWGMFNLYSWFEVDAGRVDRIELEVDEPAELTLWGYYFMWPMFEEDGYDNADMVADASIVLLDVDNSLGFPIAFLGDEIATANSDGVFTISFGAPGTYVISAIEGDPDEPLLYPWLVIHVTAPADKTALNALIGQAETLTASDYTAGTWTALQTALTAARTVAADTDATQVEVDGAKSTLAMAMDALEEIALPPPRVEYEDQLRASLAYILRTTPAPALGVTGGEWSVLALARAGVQPGDIISGDGFTSQTMPENYYSGYVGRILAFMNSGAGDAGFDRAWDKDKSQIDRRQPTENERVILGLASIGIDPRDVDGYNFLEPLSDYGWTAWQGVNSLTFALLAFDANDWVIPTATVVNRPDTNSTGVQTTRENLIEGLLDIEINKGAANAGGWALAGATPDPDITFMAIQALAPYYDDAHPEVKAAVDRALDVMSARQNDQGGFGSCESAAQGIVALSALGVNPREDPRFVTTDGNMISSLLSFYIEGGGFKHLQSQTNPDATATDQAVHALVAYDRFLNGRTSLYDMSDVSFTSIPTTPVITITAQPQGMTVTQGGITGSLSVAATVTQNAALSYQWYGNTSNSVTGGTAIIGATHASYTLPVTLTNAGSPYYYYVVVSAEGADSVTSDSAVVTVNAGGVTPPNNSIRVTFRLIGSTRSNGDVDLTDNNAEGYNGAQYVTWIATKAYTMSQGDSQYDLFTRALAEAGLQSVGADQSYVETIYAPAAFGGYALSELTNGQYSGWMLTVGGRYPGYGLKEQPLRDGDVVVWHYVNDYRYEVEDWFNGSQYPALGDGSLCNRWLLAPDVNPPDGNPRPSGTPNTGNGEPPLAGPDSWVNPFNDVGETDWFYDAVAYVQSLGLMNGVGGGRFSPGATLTRAMLVTILFRNEGEPNTANIGIFSDVADGTWYTDAVAWAGANGIVEGYANGLFGPDDPTTREQFVVILYRYAQWKELATSKTTDLSHFSDADKVSDWAREAMAWSVAEGLIQGRTLTTIAPASAITRAEAATLLMRFENLM